MVPKPDQSDQSAGVEDFRSRTARTRRRQTRTKLVEALFSIVDNGDLGRISIDELRHACALSRGAFYRYFSTLDDMLLQVSGAIGAQINLEMSERFDADTDPARRISRHIRYFVSRAAHDRSCALLLLRTLPVTGTVSDFAREHARIDFVEAQAAGQFDLISTEVALELGHGMGMAMLRTATLDGYDPRQLSAGVTIMMRGFGVANAEARRLADAPLGPIATSSLRAAAIALLSERDGG